MSEKETWWVQTTKRDGTYDEPEVGQVWRDAKDPDRFIVFLPGSECETYPPWVRLVAPVVPLSIEGDVAAVTVEQHRDLGVALAAAMIAMFRASFEGGTPLIALRGSHLISPDVQADVERWYASWEARHQEGIRAMHRAMDLLRQAQAEAAA